MPSSKTSYLHQMNQIALPASSGMRCGLHLESKPEKEDGNRIAEAGVRSRKFQTSEK
jgi:hypothetical protein